MRVRKRPDRIAGLAPLGIAWGGLVLGHLLGYLVAYPDEATRHVHLAVTGHGSFHVAVLSLVAVVPVALGLFGAMALAGGGAVRVGGTVAELALLQVPAFVLLELAERSFSVPVTVADPALVAGVLAQLAVALGAALLLAGFPRTVRAVAARLRGARGRAAPAARPPAPPGSLPRPAFLAGARRRAPPALATR